MYLLYFSLGLLFLSITLKSLNKDLISLIVLFTSALFLFSFAAQLDPFLNLWDERFHALVAKNMIKHPLMPTLYNYPPPITMNYDRWDRAIVWLHKQPFFLWQISLSYKLFGISEFATRIPSVIMSSLLIPITYRTGKLLVNSDVGYFSALFFITLTYLCELISGKAMLDHNDVAFLFYVSASIWVLIEYLNSGKIIWAVLIGLFSGLSILCKWLTGLVAFSGWIMFLVLIAKKRKSKGGIGYLKLSHFILSLCITFLVVLPWQYLTFSWYPTETLASFKYNSFHFFNIVEGHAESYWYYFSNFKYIYSLIIMMIIPFSFFILIKEGSNRKIVLSFLFIPFIVYIFFTLATTKMPSYTFMVSLPILISIGTFYNFIVKLICSVPLLSNVKKAVFIIITFILVLLNLDIPVLIKNHSITGNNAQCRLICLYNKKVFESLRATVPSNSIVFNVKGRTYVDCMFYSGLTSYNFIPSKEQFFELSEKNLPIVIFISEKDNLPEYLLNYKNLIIKHASIGSCEE